MPKAHKLSYEFYARDAEQVAKSLLGKILVHKVAHKTGDLLYKGRIVETEAYLGEHDLACHASKGITKRTKVIFGKAGHAYVYLIYGMYDMFNVVTGKEGEGQAVLIRALEPLENIVGKTDGPGKLTKAMGITRTLNAKSLMGESLWLEQAPSVKKIVTTTRIGIDYAKEWKDALLRFYDANNDFISKP